MCVSKTIYSTSSSRFFFRLIYVDSILHYIKSNLLLLLLIIYYFWSNNLENRIIIGYQQQQQQKFALNLNLDYYSFQCLEVLIENVKNNRKKCEKKWNPFSEILFNNIVMMMMILHAVPCVRYIYIYCISGTITQRDIWFIYVEQTR